MRREKQTAGESARHQGVLQRMRFLDGLADPPQYDPKPKPGPLIPRTGTSGQDRGQLSWPGGTGGEQGVSAEMSVVWMDRRAGQGLTACRGIASPPGAYESP